MSLKDIVRLIFQEESRHLAPDQQTDMESSLAALEKLPEDVLAARLEGIGMRALFANSVHCR